MLGMDVESTSRAQNGHKLKVSQAHDDNKISELAPVLSSHSLSNGQLEKLKGISL
jgi:hypothetical protein